MSTYLILLVEEDESTRSFLAQQLTADGYEVLLAHSRQHALHLLSTHHPHLVLADINGRTLGLLDAIRGGHGFGGELDPSTPMIVLSARVDELAKVRVFDHGGDDVVSKPFSYLELRGRIRAVLRRAHVPRPVRVSRVGALQVDHLARRVQVGQSEVKLTAKEYTLLQTLIAQPGRVYTREELLQAVWGHRYPSRTLDSTACRLRQKLGEKQPGRPLVLNVWGVGYRLTEEVNG